MPLFNDFPLTPSGVLGAPLWLPCNLSTLMGAPNKFPNKFHLKQTRTNKYINMNYQPNNKQHKHILTQTTTNPSLEVKSYPTIKFYVRGRKDDPVDPGFKAGHERVSKVSTLLQSLDC